SGLDCVEPGPASQASCDRPRGRREPRRRAARSRGLIARPPPPDNRGEVGPERGGLPDRRIGLEGEGRQSHGLRRAKRTGTGTFLVAGTVVKHGAYGRDVRRRHGFGLRRDDGRDGNIREPREEAPASRGNPARPWRPGENERWPELLLQGR